MRSSKLECKIADILEQAELPFKEEYIFSDLCGKSGNPLRFDFCVLLDDGSIDFLIEAQGEQHYRAVSRFGGQKTLYRQQHNDALKRKYCLEHGYKLVAIPYWDYQELNYDYIMKAAGY